MSTPHQLPPYNPTFGTKIINRAVELASALDAIKDQIAVLQTSSNPDAGKQALAALEAFETERNECIDHLRDFGDCIDRARDRVDEDIVDVDAEPIISVGDDGVYVQAWVYVDVATDLGESGDDGFERLKQTLRARGNNGLLEEFSFRGRIFAPGTEFETVGYHLEEADPAFSFATARESLEAATA